MRVPATHRVNRELSAWLCALIVVAGLSLTSSLPRSGDTLAELPSRTLAAAAETLGDVLANVVAPSRESGASMLKPHCERLPVPYARELAAVLRGVSTAYPGSVVTVSWVGQHPRATRVVSVCDR